jgi:DNA-binding transcriptional MerR regulator
MSLSITEVAKQTGLSAYTLRYYERIGLIRSIPRSSGGQRYYRHLDLAWIEFLLRLRSTGMPIQQMQQFAQWRSIGDRSLSLRRELLEQHQAKVCADILQLQQSLSILQAKIDHYRQQEQAFVATSN